MRASKSCTEGGQGHADDKDVKRKRADNRRSPRNALIVARGPQQLQKWETRPSKIP